MALGSTHFRPFPMHERGQERNGVVTPFDDTEVAGEALRALKTTA